MNTTTTSGRMMRVIVGVISMVSVTAMLVVLGITPGSDLFVDRVDTVGNAVSQTVSPMQSELYCPEPMGLSDTGTYGDSAYQATSGNLSTQAQYAAFGSVYSALVTRLDANAGGGDVTLKDFDLLDETTVRAGSQSIKQGSRLLETRLLQADEGIGAAGSIVSWADEGDLQGLSSASCVAPALEQRFLLTSTVTGTTQQLIVANPSAKATTVEITAWGSENGKSLSLSTQSSLSIPARGESVLDISAAASNHDGLYVTVSSAETPVAAVVRTVVMDGLTPKGSDFALPLPKASNTAVAASIGAGDAVSAYLFSKSDTHVTLSWVTNNGLVDAQDLTLQSDQVSAVDLDKAPDHALGLMLTAEDAVSMSVRATSFGKDGQEDFALIRAGMAVSTGAMAFPEGYDAALTLANASTDDTQATVEWYQPDGKPLGTRTVALPANAASNVELEHMKSAAIIVVRGHNAVEWGVRLNRHGRDDTVTGFTALSPTSLMPQETHVWARSTPGLIR